jgi:hypothetical protein
MGAILPRMVTRSASAAGPAFVAHIVVGWFYLAGGLVIPGYALLPLWVLWALLGLWLVRLAVRRSWWTPLPPVVAAVVFVLVLVLGEQVLDWQA